MDLVRDVHLTRETLFPFRNRKKRRERKEFFFMLNGYRGRDYTLHCLPGVTIALLMAAGLRLYGTHFPTTSELSQFVLASPTVKRLMLEPLASVLREGFRKRGQREIFEREIFEREILKETLYMQARE